MPRAPRPGSRVAVVAPSGPVDVGLLAEGCSVLRGWNLEVRPGAHLEDRHGALGYLAAPDLARAGDLQQAWLDPGIDAVLCARGGYGAQRIADLLDWDAMGRAAPKVFAGFSDITALHEAFALRLGVATLHGPSVASGAFTSRADVQAGLRCRLLHDDGWRRWEVRSGVAGCLVPGRATGITAGGNLSLLAAAVGTADGRGGGGFAGRILLLEDVGEQPYRIDRMLTQLLRAGALDGVAGVALGSWTDCGPAPDIRALMLDRLGPLGVPVAWDLGFGHGAAQPTIPLGVPALLDATSGVLGPADRHRSRAGLGERVNPAEAAEPAEVAVVRAHVGVVLDRERGQLHSCGEVAGRPHAAEQPERDVEMARARGEKTDIRPVQPVRQVADRGRCRNRSFQDPGIRGNAEKAEQRRCGQSHISLAVERILPPGRGPLMLREARDHGVQEQVDVDNDHLRRPALPMISSSSSSSASRLNPARSNPGRSAD